MPAKSTTEENNTSGVIPAAPWRLKKIQPQPNYILEVEFNDGTHGFVEMKSLIMGEKAGVFAALKDINLFNQVFLEYGVATWPGEIDLAPDAMHQAIQKNGKWIL